MQSKNVFTKQNIAENANRTNKKSLLVVYVSLFLAMALFSSATFSWFTVTDTATIASDTLTMNASSGLRVNEGAEITNVITLDNVVLSEASSVDGRNIFFPLSGNYESSTSAMKFREGSVGDQNQLYAYKNFTITGDSELTQIFVKSYNVVVTDKSNNTYKYNGGTEIVYENNIPVSQVKKQECPVRIAFILDSAEDPILIDPTALVDNHVTNYNAVKSVSSNGTPFCEETNATSFSNHYFAYNDPIFELFGSESKNVSMVVWLESTAESAVCDKFAGASVSVDIELESNFTDNEIIYFVDETLGDDGSTANGNWINKNGSCIVTMAYYDESDKATKTIVMNAISSTKWYAPLPKSVTTNISFYRYDLSDEVIYNAWYTKEGVYDETSSTVKGWLLADTYAAYNNTLQTDRGTGTTYTALRGNGYSVTENEAERLSPCIGFWDYTSSGGGDDGGGDEGGGDTDGGLLNIGIAVNIPDDKAWISDNLRNGYKMYAIISTDGTEKAHEIATNTNDYKRCESQNLQIISGSVLKRFELRSSYDTKVLSLVSEIDLTTSYNYTLTVNSSDNIQQQ